MSLPVPSVLVLGSSKQILGAVIAAGLLSLLLFYLLRRGPSAVWISILGILAFGVIYSQLERTLGFPFALVYGFGIILVTVVAVFLHRPKLRVQHFSYVDGLVLAFLGYQLLQLFNPLQPDWGSKVLQLRHPVIGVVLFFLTRSVVRNTKQISSLLWMTSILGFVVATYGLFQAAVGVEALNRLGLGGTGDFELRLSESFNTRMGTPFFRVPATFKWWGTLASYLVLALVANLGLHLQNPGKYRSYLALSSLAIFFCLPFTYMVDSLMLLVLLAAIVGVALGRSVLLRLGRFGLAGMVLLLVLSYGTGWSFVRYTAINLDIGTPYVAGAGPSVTLRFLDARDSLQASTKSIIFGTGLGSGASPQRFAEKLGLQTQPASNPITTDSPYLFALVETGVVGLGLLLALQIAGIIRGFILWRSLRHPSVRATGIVMVAYLLIFIPANFVQHLLPSVPVGSYYWIILAIVLNLKTIAENSGLAREAVHMNAD